VSRNCDGWEAMRFLLKKIAAPLEKKSQLEIPVEIPVLFSQILFP
jgi:hypothetical protein